MRVLVCGSRYWTRRHYLFGVLDSLHEEMQFTVVIEGEAPGADRMAALWARRHDVAVAAYPADWAEHGRAAGPIRNRRMLAEGKPDLVVAFHERISASKGTIDMMRQAGKAGVKVMLFNGKPTPSRP